MHTSTLPSKNVANPRYKTILYSNTRVRLPPHTLFRKALLLDGCAGDLARFSLLHVPLCELSGSCAGRVCGVCEHWGRGMFRSLSRSEDVACNNLTLLCVSLCRGDRTVTVGSTTTSSSREYRACSSAVRVRMFAVHHTPRNQMLTMYVALLVVRVYALYERSRPVLLLLIGALVCSSVGSYVSPAIPISPPSVQSSLLHPSFVSLPHLQSTLILPSTTCTG